MQINLPEDVKKIISKLKDHGYDSYAVGGAIRDAIMGNEPKDWDVASLATPDQMKEVFSGEKLVPTGEEFGTLSLIINEESYEITTFRNDGRYSDSRHPDEVRFAKTIEEDLSRRDFTINAMAYNDEIGLIDPFNGVEDIGYRFIRCVGDSDERFEEDPLRMMRAVRFSNRFFAEIRDDSMPVEKIHRVSAERIREELNKIILDNPRGINYLEHQGLLREIIPELQLCFKSYQINPYHKYYRLHEHIIDSMKNIDSVLHLRLAMMFHDIGKPHKKTTENGIDHFYKHELASADIAEIVMRRLKYDNKIIEDVVCLVKNHSYEIVASKKQARKILNKLGERLSYDLLKVCVADDLAKDLSKESVRKNIFNIIKTEVLFDEIIRDKECFGMKDLAINGNDLIEIGFSEGRILGEILKYLLDIVIENPDDNEYEILLDVVKKNWNIS